MSSLPGLRSNTNYSALPRSGWWSTRSAVLARFEHSLWRSAATRSFRTPVDGWLQPDGAERDFVRSGIASADRATYAPPGPDEGGRIAVGWLEENWPSRGQCSDTAVPASRPHRLAQSGPVFGYRRTGLAAA